MMMRVRSMLMIVIGAVFMALATAPLTMAAQVTRDELKQRFEDRDAQIQKLKAAGKIGETWQGYVERVQDAELNRGDQDLLEQENADRRKLYQLIAEDVKSGKERIPAEKVAERNASRNFMTAKPSEFLKIRSGQWIRRNDINPLKRDGKVGETWEGYVAAVNDASLNERQQALLEAENEIRRDIYRRQSKESDSTLEREAQRAGGQNIEKARSGEFVKRKDGGWQRVR